MRTLTDQRETSNRIITYLLEEVVDRALMETEEPEYFETEHKLRPETAARIEASYAKAFGQSPHEGDVSYSIGGRTYNRIGGEWREERRTKNPAHWDKPAYFIIYGEGPTAFCVVKRPGRLTQRSFEKAVSGIYKDWSGKSWSGSEARGVDGTDQEIFDRRVSGEKPESAYEIFLDGTWKRLK